MIVVYLLVLGIGLAVQIYMFPKLVQVGWIMNVCAIYWSVFSSPCRTYMISAYKR